MNAHAAPVEGCVLGAPRGKTAGFFTHAEGLRYGMGLLPLAGAGGGWLLQSLSCGYYLFFFSPVVLLYIVWEMTTRGLWRDPRTVSALAVLCAIVAALTAPFMLPYLELRRLGFDPRSLREIDRFSADRKSVV